MKKIAAILLTAVMMLTACAPKGQHVPSDNDTEEDKVTEITIPASYLDFTGNDAEETAEDYKAYCTDAAVQDGNVVLEVNEQQMQEILEMNQDFIDDALESKIFSLCPALSEPWNGTVVPSRAYTEGGIHEAIAYYEDNVFYEILAEELSRRDMDYPEITEENYDEITGRMDQYMSEFEACGVDHLVLEEE